MASDLPLKLLLITFAEFVNRDHSRLIDYPLEENRILRELHRDKKPRLNDDQRRRLAAKGKTLGRRLLDKVDDDRHTRNDPQMASQAGRGAPHLPT